MAMTQKYRQNLPPTDYINDLISFTVKASTLNGRLARGIFCMNIAFDVLSAGYGRLCCKLTPIHS